MSLTPNSSLTPYATPADMLVYYDIRPIADLCSDNNTRLGTTPPNPNPDHAIVAASPILAQMLLVASGMVEAALLRADRYGVADLQALDGASQAFLIKLVCDLTMGELYRRRPDKGMPPPFYTAALEWLEHIASGDRVFAFAETEAAGLPLGVVDSQQTLWQRGMMAQRAARYYGNDLADEWCGFYGPGGW